MTDTDLHTAIEGLRDWARAEADHAEEMVKQWAVKARLEGDPAHNEQRWRADAYARREAADRLDSILASHPRGEAEQLRAERDEARWGEGWPNLQGIEYCVKCDDPNDLLSVPNESCGHDGTVNRRRGSIEVVPLSRAEAWRLRAEAAEAERDRLREALADDRDKWGFDTLLMVGDLLLERVYPEGVPLISEGDDPGPRLVRAVRDCRAALSEQEGGGECECHTETWPNPNCPLHGEQQGARGDEDCRRCGHKNPPWAAPSPLWNAVMRGGSINGGPEPFEGIICPSCFTELADAKGIASIFRLDARTVNVELETVTPSGRVWDSENWRWAESVQKGEQPRSLHGEQPQEGGEQDG